MRDLHQLHLVELVLAYHAARVASVGASLAAEARRMRHELHRQFFQRNDLVAHHVGHRDFGGGDQIEIFSTPSSPATRATGRNRSSSNFGNCPVPRIESALTM